MTARILVIADTHMNRGSELPPQLAGEIDRADMIVHLGDFTGVELADRLEGTGKLIAVRGNNDVGEIRRRYPDRRDFVVGDTRIRCIHGDVGGRTARDAAAAEEGADIVLYGHSHFPEMTRAGDTILFNPGSPTRRRFAPYHSYGILNIGNEIDAQIVPVESR
jgi:putative phosphoesterase